MKKILLFLFVLAGLNGFSQISVRTSTTPTQLTAGNGTVVVRSGTVTVANTATNINVTSTITTGNVGDFHVKQNVTCVTTTGAYSVGECLGASASNTFTSARSSGATSVLNEIMVSDSSNQKGAIMVYFFNAAPTGTVTDNGTFQMSPDDLKNKLLGQYQILSSDYTTSGRYAVAHGFPLRELVLKPSTGTTIWFIAVIGGTYTYGASALYFRFGLKQD